MRSGLTVFIPLYNEEAILEENVRKFHDAMGRLKVPYELILGSNGSTDRTLEIGQRLDMEDSRIIFFHVPLRGPGLAFKEALRRARYSYILCLDADLSVDLDFIPRAIEILKDYDAVIGSKQVGVQKRPLLRIMASEIFIAFTKFLLQMPYRDYSIGAKAFRTGAIRPFLGRVDRHTFYIQELIYHLQKTGKRIMEIPVYCDDRRRSRFNLVHEGFYRYSRLLKLWLRRLQE